MSKIIDSHVHLGKFNVVRSKVYGWLDVAPDVLMQYIEDFKLSNAWLLSHPHIAGQYDMNGSEETLGLAQSYPALKPFCQIDRASPDCLGRYVDKGCVGIGEIKMPLPINHPSILAVFKVAKDYGLPVVVHMTDKYCFESSDKALAEALDVGANIIFHGWGWWNKLRTGEAASWLKSHENVYMDISANSGLKSLSENLEYSRSFLKEHSDRVLYGSDFPMLTIYDGSQFGTNRHHLTLLEKLELTEQIKENILHRNAEKLVK